MVRHSPTRAASGHRGVSLHKGSTPLSNKWQAAINVNRKQIYLGLFKDIKDAIAARLDAEVRYGFSQEVTTNGNASDNEA